MQTTRQQIKREETKKDIKAYKQIMKNKSINYRINIKSEARWVKNQYTHLATFVRYGWGLDFLTN